MRAAVVLLIVVAIASAQGCDARDCAEERSGQQRCVNNRLETCNEDGTLSYESCNSRGLVCSEELKACVTAEVAMTTSGGGGSTPTGGGAPGQGGMAQGTGQGGSGG